MNTQSVSRMFRATCICGAVESRRATSQEEADRLLGGHRVPTWPSLMVLAPEGKLGVVKSTLDGALAGLLNGMFVSVVVPEKCAVVMVPTAASYVTGPSAVDLGPALERFGASIGTIETPGAGSFCCSARCMAGCVRQSLIGKRSIDASGTFEGKSYQDLIGLEQILHDSPTVPNCLVERAYEYGVGHPLAAGEREWIRYLDQGFAADGYEFPALMRRIATSNAFQIVSENLPIGALASN